MEKQKRGSFFWEVRHNIENRSERGGGGRFEEDSIMLVRRGVNNLPVFLRQAGKTERSLLAV